MPTTIQELVESINGQWPRLDADDRAFKEIPIGPDQVLRAVHTTWTSNGPRTEGNSPPDNEQIYFTPEDAVKAFWYRWQRTFKTREFDWGHKAHTLIWRVSPEMKEYEGTYSIYCRFSMLWENREKELIAA